eukprot:Tamp_17339.p2 GENE.Tamp_17339~~Tamp_17339.p2  ORF type:complete len:150 (+),score=17.84 Tamp_17339:234-683(+)
MEITVRFTSFDTESGYDFVTIYRCTSADCSDREEVAQLSGSTVSADTTFSSSTGFLEVLFVSDGTTVGAGFEAAWSVACHTYPSWTYHVAGCETCPDEAEAMTMTHCHGSNTSTAPSLCVCLSPSLSRVYVYVCAWISPPSLSIHTQHL